MPPSNSRSPHPAHSLLARAHSPTTAAAIFQERACSKPLHLAPTSKRAPRSELKPKVRLKSAPITTTTTTRISRTSRAGHRRSGSGAGAAASDRVYDARHQRRLHRLRRKEYARRKERPKPLSAREKKSLGLRGVGALRGSKGKGKVDWEVYAGLRDLWAGYVREVLGLTAGKKPRVLVNQHGPLLASLDYHGAQVTVVRCACVGRVGVRGVVVRDTLATFAIVTRENRVVVVPKTGAVFRVEVPLLEGEGEEENAVGRGDGGAAKDEEAKKGGEMEKTLLSFELHGNQLQVRPADRANRKFKWKRMEYV